MQNIQIQLKKIWQKVKSVFSTSSYTKLGIRPAHDWEVIFVSFFSILILLFIFEGYIYLSVMRGTFEKKNTSNSSVETYSVREQDLKNVTDYFNQKALNLKNGPSPIADPSI